MKVRWQIVIGGFLVLFGLLSIIGIVFNIDLSGSFFALLLIVIGAWLLLRPRFVDDSGISDFKPIGEIRESGSWQVEDQEYWVLIGDTKLDFSTAQIPDGETTIKINGFVGGVRCYFPADVAISLSTNGFFTDVRFLGQKTDNFLAPFDTQSQGYESAAKKIHLETTHFVGDIRVKQI